MRDQDVHIKGVAVSVVAALCVVAAITGAHASTMPPPDEPAGESSSVATSDEQGESGVQRGRAQDVSAVEEGEPILAESSGGGANILSGSASTITSGVPSDGIRPRIHAIGEVVGQPAGRVLLSLNDVVTLKFDRGEHTQPRQRYAIARRAQFVEHPESGRDMGYLVHVVGTVELDEAFGRYWSGRIVSASDYIAISDLVLPLVGGEPVAEGPAQASADRTGRIVAVQDNLVLTATSQVVFTDLGADRGVKPGDEFTIVREGVTDRRGFPDRVIGVLRVTATQPTTSSAYITRSTEPIAIGDRLDPVASETPAE